MVGRTFGPMLKRLRLTAGLTQEALAERAGVSPRAVSDLERDPDRTPRLDTVTLLADALRLEPRQRADLLAAARPVAATSGPADIPRPLTALIGRAGVAAALVEVLERGQTRLLTLTGPGGVGKTRLALEVLARAGGAVFVDLAPLRDPNLVIPAVAHQFGLDERDAVPVPERLAAALRDRQVLVLLDNFEHVIDARTGLLTLLTACPGLTALVTSRVPLRVRGEREYRIAPLEAPPPGAAELDAAACVLFAERVRAAGVELAPGDTPAVAEICRRLEGLPLAIELAAARIRLLPPQVLLHRLRQRLPVLVGGPHDLPDRQRTMRDAIDWSYRLLTEPARALFRTLCGFAGGCPLPAAESISTDTAPVVDTLAELVDASLIATQPAGTELRVTMLETIREYGLERLHAAGEAEALARRHVEYFVGLAERGGPDAVEAEQDNLRAALAWALANRDAPTALRLCGAVWRFWLERGHLIEGLRAAHTALALPTADGVAASIRLPALTGAAKMAIDLARIAEATVWCGQLVGLARNAGTDRDLAAALNTRGLLARLRDQYADSARDYAEALALAEAGDDHAGRAAALIGLAYAVFHAGDIRRAEELAERGLAATRAVGNRRELANALILLAWLATHAGHNERCERLAAEGVELFRALKDTGQIAAGLRVLGTNAQLCGHYDRAAAYLEESHALYIQRGDEHVADQLLAQLSHVAMGTGDLPRARRLAEHALASARRFADTWAIAMSTTELGHIELADGHLDRARALFLESADAFQTIGNPLYLSWCLEGLAGVAATGKRFELAAALCAARDAVRVRVGTTLPPMYPPGYHATLSTLDSALGPAGVAAARAAAADRPLAELIAAVRSSDKAPGQRDPE